MPEDNDVAKKIQEQISQASGGKLAPEDVNARTIAGAQAAVAGTKKAVDAGINPSDISFRRHKQEGGGAVDDDPEEEDKQRLLARVLLAAAPLVIGGIAGGARGVGAGAKAGTVGVTEFGAQEEAEAKKEEKQKELEVLAKAEEQTAKVAALEAGAKKDKEQLKLASDLRKERNALPTTKDTQAVVAASEKVRLAAENPSAAGDLSLIFNFMKMLDPGSVVREGEFANAQNAAGIPDRIRNAYNRALEGERLNPNQRADFLDQSKRALAAQLQTQNRVDESFVRLAGTAGVSPDQVIVQFASPEQLQFAGVGGAVQQAPSQGPQPRPPSVFGPTEAVAAPLDLGGVDASSLPPDQLDLLERQLDEQLKGL